MFSGTHGVTHTHACLMSLRFPSLYMNVDQCKSTSDSSCWSVKSTQIHSFQKLKTMGEHLKLLMTNFNLKVKILRFTDIAGT